MLIKRVTHLLARAASRLLPRSLHTPGLRAHRRVESLTQAQRERLKRNLQAMLRPETA
jgi:hypothetical protein